MSSATPLTKNWLETRKPRSLKSPHRRQVLCAALGGAVGWMVGTSPSSWAGTPSLASSPSTSNRLALLIGNADYPAPHDLPPIHKNVMDLSDALAERGFDVTEAMDLNEEGLLATVREFVGRVAKAPADSTTFFYYAGHGLQVEANNLLLGCGINPRAPRKDLLANSLVLQHQLLAQLPAHRALTSLITFSRTTPMCSRPMRLTTSSPSSSRTT